MAQGYVSVMDPAYEPPDDRRLATLGLLRGLLDVSPVGAGDLLHQVVAGQSRMTMPGMVAGLLGAPQAPSPSESLSSLLGIGGEGPAYETGRAVVNAIPLSLLAASRSTVGSPGRLLPSDQRGSLLPEASVDPRLSEQWFAVRAKRAQRNATAPVGRAGFGLGSRNTAEQRMQAMGLERGWYRGGEAPVTTRETPATGQWYTRSADEAANYATRAATPDMREYAIPSKMLDLMERQSPEVARKIGEQLMTSGDPAVRRFAQQYIDAAQAGESLDGRALFQGLHNTFGMDVAADAVGKAGFSGVRNWNTTGDAFVFPGRTIRDANRAAFDPAFRARNDIYGSADPSLLGLLGAGGTIGALYAHSRREK